MTNDYFHKGHVPYIDGGNKCPECGYPMKCPCKNCKDNVGEFKVFQWSTDGNSKICSECGFTEDGNYWFMWQLACYDMIRDNKDE